MDLYQLEAVNTVPLWTQMTKLNPPLPNPKCKPYVWQFDKIRPLLIQAGELVTEKQAERRVLMLVNPERGTDRIFSRSITIALKLNLRRCTVHHRHHLRWITARHA